MNIWDRARLMARQSKTPMSESEALSLLSRRRRRVISTVPAPSKELNAHLNTIETPRSRLPYKDD